MLQDVTGSYRMLQDMANVPQGITDGYRRLQAVTGGYRKLHIERTGIQPITGSYRELQEITGFLWVTESYM